MPKTAIITGGAQGIGFATALYLLKKSWNVILADIDPDAGKEAVDELSKSGNAVFIETDVSSEPSVNKMIHTASEHFSSIDGLVNNAGIFMVKPLSDLSIEEWNRVLGVNLTGAFLCSKTASPFLKKSKGAIVNIASTRALMSEKNTEAYSATKGGIVSLTHALSVSLGPDVRVNCVSPGWIETGDWKKKSTRQKVRHSEQDNLQHPAGRVGVPNDAASIIAYLLSDESGFITGANFTVDGGMTRKMIYL